MHNGRKGADLMAVSRRQFLQLCGLCAAGVVGTNLAGCGGESASSVVPNTEKPVVFFNRQPSNGSTGEIDMTTLTFNKDTYYVGFDAQQGGELEGQMVVDYIKNHIDTVDRNGDGTIGYILAIGDVGHNDSIARTRGVRKALGTAVEENGVINTGATGTNADGSSDIVQDGEIEVDGKTFKIRELASQEMKTTAGATWDAPTAGNAIGTWAASFGDQIDLVVSNNDGMGMAMFNSWSYSNHVPTFGYDANADAVAAIPNGYGGTISQNPAVQAYINLRLSRNSLDGVDFQTGISTPDDKGNIISPDDYRYSEDERSFYAMNLMVNADTYENFLDSTKLYETAQTALDESTSPIKKVWASIYNAADNFLSSTYRPLLQKYQELMNFKIDFVAGDGQSESSVSNRLANPSDYDAFAINMVKTDNGASYTGILRQ